MSDLPGQPAPDPSESKTPSRFPLRRIGEYLLVSQLGDDALGSVYRALHTSDGRFVRLRVLQSPELSPRTTLAVARRQVECRPAIRPSELARHGEIHFADSIPYLIWPETNGWTLDLVLARARAGGWGMPIEFALLIAERAASEIEQASLSALAGEPVSHGALWPGFVSISSDAEVRVEGFGLAETVLPALAKARMWRDVAPYIAPEVRETGRASPIGDVYSIGVLLTELLTGQRASADTPPPRWRADDDFSQEVSLLLGFALAHPSERFSSIGELHASLKELTAACPFEISPADLALFLYELLNPESRILPAPFDGSSTNPLARERRRTSPARRPSATSSYPSSAPHQKWQIINPQSNPAVFGVPPAERSISLVRWTGRAAAVAAAIASLVFLDLPIRRATVPLVEALAGQTRTQASSPMASPTAASFTARIQQASLAAFPRFAKEASAPTPPKRQMRAASAAAQRRAESRAAAETLRLKAALARIDAERLDAPLHAADLLAQGRSQERDGERLLFRGDYAAAGDAYARALDLFNESEARSREERVRQIQIAGDAVRH